MLMNYSSATEFCLLGFPRSEELHYILFALFFFFYLVTLMGNTVIIVTVCVDKRLQSPMYFLLGHLSALEILVTTIIVPGMLLGLLFPGMQTVSLSACVVQLFLYLSMGTLLGAMAVDCYMAVYNPLRCNIIMNRHTCNFVVLVSWVFGFLFQIWPVYITLQLTYYKSNVVNNFFFYPLLNGCFVLFGSLIPTIVSYTYIISTILKILSASGQRKSFSTRASHFTCVVMGYGSCLFLYLKPKQMQAADYNRVVSLMVAVVTPFLNPFIFTHRNDKVIEALRDGVKCCCQLFRN
uniref:G-protein coupled receptors family 1 profile domain-containing protein n=1 Tax=Colobus angolensis palliatus TaxID=336983 RepID=A0A2K5HPB1_COLAP